MSNAFAFGIGVDILHLSRLHHVFSRRGTVKFARKILTSREYAEFELRCIQPPAAESNTKDTSQNAGSASPLTGNQNALDPVISDPKRLRKAVHYLSTCWAVKEAAYKASANLRETPEIGWLGWKNFELSHAQNGRPVLRVLGKDKILTEGKISVSHDGDYVIAMAVIPDTIPEQLKP